MTATIQCRFAACLTLAIAVSMAGQTTPSAAREPSQQSQRLESPPASSRAKALLVQDSSPSLNPSKPQDLFDFKDSDVKFNLQSLMEILRDHKHEGWVLAAYPDPKTSRPLIGAGFSLDVMATEHPQRDPLNPHRFIEPSSAALWVAAGLEPSRLQRILDQFDRELKTRGKKNFRKKIRRRTLTPEVTEAEATSLLRISAIQAIYNAKAYCRSFDGLTASQQMALSQLVFQMGVNLEEFVHFLGVMNFEGSSRDVSQPDGVVDTQSPQWPTVQQALIESQWARRYTGRATTVIAMFDPDYAQDPGGAERRVASILPPVTHSGRRHSNASLRVVSYRRHTGRVHVKGTLRSQRKRKST